MAAVRESCNVETDPYYHAIAGGNLANIYSDRAYSADVDEYANNLSISLDLQNGAINRIDKATQPEEWGILHHNIGCTYTRLFEASKPPASGLNIIDAAIRHLDMSFDVRDPEADLQYWIASSRSLAEALIARSAHVDSSQAKANLDRAAAVLADAMSKISEADHPNQWEALVEQRERLAGPLDQR
jgi:hypothetical protein